MVNLSKKASDSGFSEEFETEQQEQVLDNLNLLYVAFTRAVERLHIIASAGESNRQKTVAEWITGHMATHYQQKEGVYVIGKAAPKQKENEKNGPGNFIMHPLQFETHADAIRIKAAYLNKYQETENAKQRGITLHALMSEINDAASINPVLEKAVLNGLMTTEEKPEYAQKINAIIHHPELITFFSPQTIAKPEAELITPQGDVLRPDRVVFSDDEVTIIDYKTGSENDKKYARQLMRYGDALASMGYKKIKKMLVYVDEIRVLTVN